MADPKGITDEMLEAALRRNGGVFSLAAEQLGVARQTVWVRCQGEAMKTVLADIKERTLDIVDGQLIKLIQKGDAATIRWYAERQGKSRGYGNSTDIGLSSELVDRLLDAIGHDPAKLLELERDLEK